MNALPAPNTALAASDLASARRYVEALAQSLDPASRYVHELLALIDGSQSLADLESQLIGKRAHLHAGDEAFARMTLGEKLMASLLTAESEAFRFSAPEERAFSLELSRRRQPVRILCVPCARGFEVFSLAAYALRAGVSCEIDAVDIQPRLIERAWDTLEAPAFDRDRSAIQAAIRAGAAQIRFRAGDARSVDGGPYDFIFCRNLLGYFVEPAAWQIIESLLRVAGAGAWLLLDDFCLGKMPGLSARLGAAAQPIEELAAYRLASRDPAA